MTFPTLAVDAHIHIRNPRESGDDGLGNELLNSMRHGQENTRERDQLWGLRVLLLVNAS